MSNPIIAIPDWRFRNLQSIIFPSIAECVNFFGMTRIEVLKAIGDGLPRQGYFFDEALTDVKGNILSDVIDKATLQAQNAYARKMAAKNLKLQEVQNG